MLLPGSRSCASSPSTPTMTPRTRSPALSAAADVLRLSRTHARRRGGEALPRLNQRRWPSASAVARCVAAGLALAVRRCSSVGRGAGRSKSRRAGHGGREVRQARRPPEQRRHRGGAPIDETAGRTGTRSSRSTCRRRVHGIQAAGGDEEHERGSIVAHLVVEGLIAPRARVGIAPRDADALEGVSAAICGVPPLARRVLRSRMGDARAAATRRRPSGVEPVRRGALSSRARCGSAGGQSGRRCASADP